MGKNHGIDIADIFPERLAAEIGSGIHHESALGRFDVNGRTRPLIARIGRSTHWAITTDHRHTLRCTGAKEGNGELRVED